MNVTIEIPDDRAAYYLKQAQARGLSISRWLLELAEQNIPAQQAQDPSKGTMVALGLKVRGLADDLDFSRDRSPGRDTVL